MKVKLKEITLNITDGKHGDCESQKGSGYYFLSVKDIENNEINYKNAREITRKDFLETDKRTKLEVGDTIFANSGHTIGKSLYIKNSPWVRKSTFQKSVALLKPNLEIIESRYLYYLLKYETPRLRQAAVGSAQKNLLLDDLRNFETNISEKDKQKDIAKILGNIDDKIALNNKINNELEQMAKALYDYWFVQFDFPNEEGKPYKSSGGKMVWNEELKREIPEGWKVKPLKDICHIKRGASPRPIDEYMDKKNLGMPWIKISDATKNTLPFLLNVKESIISEGVSKSVLVSKGTLIISNSATPGIPKFIDLDACVHDGWLVIKDYQEEYKYYLYFNFVDMRKNLMQIASGSIFKNLKTDYLKEYKCIISNSELMVDFHKKIDGLMNKILFASRENQELTKLRDWLLPILMNGQARFKD